MKPALSDHCRFDPIAVPAGPACAADTGHAMFAMMVELFGLHRSIMGDGLRQTLRILQREITLQVQEVATGTPVWDWSVPQEWRIRDAYIQDQAGRRVVDYRASNLHIANYSRPIRQRMRWSDLRTHVRTEPTMPDCTPYRTLFFRDDWAFCLPQRLYEELDTRPLAEYDVVIDAEFVDGAMSIGELLLPGEQAEEFLFYTHTCHPSLANDNLSGIVVATWLAKSLAARPARRWSYRFVFAPATIGALTWLALRHEELHRIRQGLVLALLGDPAPLTYKRSQREDAEIDQVAQHVLQHWSSNAAQRPRIQPFSPFGYDERQFNAPGFDLPMGCLMRSVSGGFAEYHTSDDNLDLVTPAALTDSWLACLSIVDAIEYNRTYRNRYPFGEPQLGRRGLYRAYFETDDRGRLQEAMLWILNQANGDRPLIEIARRADLPCDLINRATQLLIDHQLLESTPHRGSTTSGT